MLGLIKEYDPETKTGIITIGKENFPFDASVWIPEALPEQGDEVVFELRGVKPYNVNFRGAALDKTGAVKSRVIAILLALFTGWMGGHRFYLGDYRVAFVQCILTVILVTSGLMGYALLWSLVDALLIFGGHIDKDGQGRPLK